MQVLIADDDDDDFFIFSHASAELQVKVVLTRAENGALLLRLLDEKNPDILFLDILLPEKDGRQCLREIRANQKYDTLPIIMYTSLSDLDHVEFCFREGANFFIVKPNSFTELKEVLQRLFTLNWNKALYYPPRPDFVLNPQ